MGAKTRRLRSIIAFAALGIIGTAAAAAFEAQLSSQLRLESSMQISRRARGREDEPRSYPDLPSRTCTFMLGIEESNLELRKSA